MNIFIVIEQADIEIIRIDCYPNRERAEQVFQACCAENKANEVDLDQLEPELRGTLALAGDDAYSVQLIERQM